MAKKQLSTSKVQPGMTLAEPITDAGGRVIVAAGVKLSAVVISRLEKWDVASVAVETGEESAPAAEAAPEEPGERTDEIDARLARLDAVFSRVRDDPIMAALHELARRHVAAWTGRPGRK